MPKLNLKEFFCHSQFHPDNACFCGSGVCVISEYDCGPMAHARSPQMITNASIWLETLKQTMFNGARCRCADLGAGLVCKGCRFGADFCLGLGAAGRVASDRSGEA